MTLLAVLLRFVNIFCAGIATGTWVVTQLALIPARRELPAPSAILLHKVTGREIDRFNPLCAATSAITGLAVLLLGLAANRTSAILTLVGCFATLGASVQSIFVNMPINRTVAAWPEGTVPPEFAEVFERWYRGNLIRTVFGLLAFSCYVLAVLL